MRRRHAAREALGSTLGLGFVAALAWLARRDRPRPSPRRSRPAPRLGGDAELPDVPDDELVARVREHVAIPLDVELTAQDGAVVLFGRAPRYLVRELLERVASVPGVTDVEDRLTPVDLVAPERPPGPPDPP